MNTEETSPAPKNADRRCGFVAIIGAPNVGKSTLLNTLVGAKVSIVTRKIQTTRSRILGIAMRGQTQLVFVDTPGIFKPRRRLDRAMVAAAWRGAGDADIVVVLIDAVTGLDAESRAVLNRLSDQDRHPVLVINKVDAVKRDKLLSLTDSATKLGNFREIFMISALKNDGVDDLANYLAGVVPQGPWHYPEDQLTDISERLLAAEITREKIYLMLHHELPYASAVEPLEWRRQKDGSVRIEQVVFVQRGSQKGIVIGKGGRTLKAIGQKAREDIELLLGCRAHLFLRVKVRENWAENPYHYREIGLDFVE